MRTCSRRCPRSWQQQLDSRSSALAGVFLAIASWQAATLATTVYLHRYVAHRSIRLHPGVAASFRVVVWALIGIDPVEYRRVHLSHHRQPDRPGDPHSPAIDGFWRVTVATPWLYRRWLASVGGRSSGWRAWLRAGPVGQLLLAAILGVTVSPATGAAWIFLNAALYTLSFGALAALGHTGRDRGGRIGRARDIGWLGALSGGEYLHLSHHITPGRWRFSDGHSYQDPGGLLIAGLIRLKLAAASK